MWDLDNLLDDLDAFVDSAEHSEHAIVPCTACCATLVEGCVVCNDTGEMIIERPSAD